LRKIVARTPRSPHVPSACLLLASVLFSPGAQLARGQGVDTTRKATTAYADTTKAADTATVRTYGGFVDTYYAWDFDRPRFFDRAYTTQSARHAEANINLAYIENKWTGPRTRGRLALQWGTSVQANYAGEPKIGGLSGPSVSQFIQEAVVGYQLAPAVWLDAGIFFSHIGYESFISRDNLTYTRSLIAEYSPYYEAGAKLTWTATPQLTATFALVNGWQEISTSNTPPAGGLRLDYAVTPKVTLTYDNFIGNAAPDDSDVQMRVYHDVIAQYNPSDLWQFAAVYSIGSESNRLSSGGTASWWGTSAIAKYHVTPRLAFVGRVEHYSDPSQVIVVTGLPEPFITTAASLGVDVNLRGATLWRTEFRGFHSTNAVWPTHSVGGLSDDDSFLTSSLGFTF
jgi:hypothetical protein